MVLLGVRRMFSNKGYGMVVINRVRHLAQLQDHEQ